MPQLKGKKARTSKGISENIKREIKSGKPPKQAAAIAYAVSRRSKKGNK